MNALTHSMTLDGLAGLGLGPEDACYDPNHPWWLPNMFSDDIECACMMTNNYPIGQQCASVKGVAQTTENQISGVTQAITQPIGGVVAGAISGTTQGLVTGIATGTPGAPASGIPTWAILAAVGLLGLVLVEKM